MYLYTQTSRLACAARYHHHMYPTSFISIFIAGVAAVFIGWLWKNIFGSFLTRGNEVTPEMIEQKKKNVPLMTFIAFLASMLIAYVMTYFGAAWGVYDWIGALELGFWCWAGFVVPTMLGSVLFEKKSFSAYCIDVLYWFVTFVAMALILLFTSAPAIPQSYDQTVDGQIVQYID